jgi:hypothetical protein
VIRICCQLFFCLVFFSAIINRLDDGQKTLGLLTQSFSFYSSIHRLPISLSFSLYLYFLSHIFFLFFSLYVLLSFNISYLIFLALSLLYFHLSLSHIVCFPSYTSFISFTSYISELKTLLLSNYFCTFTLLFCFFCLACS